MPSLVTACDRDGLPQLAPADRSAALEELSTPGEDAVGGGGGGGRARISGGWRRRLARASELGGSGKVCSLGVSYGFTREVMGTNL